MRLPSHPSQHPKALVRESVARPHAVPNGVTIRASLAMRAYAYDRVSRVWLRLRKSPKRDLTNIRLCVCVFPRARKFVV